MPTTTSPPEILPVKSSTPPRASFAGVERSRGAYYLRIVLDAQAELEDGRVITLESTPVRVRVTGRSRAPRPAAALVPAADLKVLRARARTESGLNGGLLPGSSALVAVDLDLEVPSMDLRLRSSAGRLRIALGPGAGPGRRMVAEGASGRTRVGLVRGRLAVKGMRVESLHRQGAGWWALLMLDLEASAGGGRVRDRAVPATVRVYHQRLPSR